MQSQVDVARAVNSVLLHEKFGASLITHSRYGFSDIQREEEGELDTESTFRPLQSVGTLEDYFSQGFNGKWNIELTIEPGCTVYTLTEIHPMIYGDGGLIHLLLWSSDAVSDGYLRRLFSEPLWRQHSAQIHCEILEKMGSPAVVFSTAHTFELVHNLEQLFHTASPIFFVWRENTVAVSNVSLPSKIATMAVEKLRNGFLWIDCWRRA